MPEPIHSPPRAEAPASSAQERLWLLCRSAEPRTILSATLGLRGSIDRDALERALRDLVVRHESLRTVFREQGGTPVRLVLAPSDPRLTPLPKGDSGACPALSAETGPLFAARLLEQVPADHVLRIEFHRLAADRRSLPVLLRDLAELYAARAQGREARLPDLPAPDDDPAAPPASDAARSSFAARVARLADPADLALPFARGEGSGGPGGSDAVSFRVTAGTARSLGHGETTPAIWLTAAFAALLARVGNTEDVVLGRVLSGRDRPGTEGVVGALADVVVLRLDVNAGTTFSGLLGQVQLEREAASAPGAPRLAQLARELGVPFDRGRDPIVRAAVVEGLWPRSARLDLPGLEVEPRASFCPAEFDLALGFEADRDGLACELEYDTGLFDRERIEALAGHLGAILSDAAADPGRTIWSLPILAAQESERVLVEWNRTALDFPADRCLHQLFEAQAASTPDAVAVVCGNRRLTYRELDVRANQLARRLRDLGVGPDSLVALYLPRSLEVFVGMLGILKAGGGYLPLETDLPDQRLAYMLDDSAAAVVVTTRDLSTGPVLAPGARQGAPLPAVCLDSDRTLASMDGTGLPATASPRNLAYTIYTSGSTGRPKGVLIEHRSVVNYVTAYVREGDLKPSDRVLQGTSIAFDVSVSEIFPALSVGATVVMLDDDERRDVERLPELIARHRITLMGRVPTVLARLNRLPDPVPGVRLIVSGGEALPFGAVDRLVDLTTVVNEYGPTETTVGATRQVVGRDSRNARALVPIGRPMPNYRVYVLDRHGNAMPVGCPGEVCIGGVGLARGYLNAPELTAARFVPDPFRPGERMYRTGDRGRWLPDGTIEFLSRLDRQVKVRGVRIELGEIQSRLLEHASVANAAVTTRTRDGETRLVAYYVPVAGVDRIPHASLSAHLKAALPASMVPAAFVPLPRLPQTPTGKLDERALPDPDSLPAARDHAYVAPRSPAEGRIARIVEEVLRCPPVGVLDDFFALGGDSLTATQAVSRIRSAFSVDFPLRALFEGPTVAALAARLATLQPDRPQAARIPRLDREAAHDFAPSFGQERVWFLERQQPGTSVFNLPSAFRLRGPLDEPALERALQELVRRHEALRTTLSVLGTELRQVVAPDRLPELDRVDLSGLPASERETRAREVLEHHARSPFDLECDLLLRAILVRLAPQESILCVTIHHAAFDVWSVHVLHEELSSLYGAFRRALPSPLPALEAQYAEYAAWQRAWLEGELLERQLAYWVGRLQGAPARLDLPDDRPSESPGAAPGDSRSLVIGRDQLARLVALGRESQATLFMVLLAAYEVLLYRCTGQTDLLVGSPIAGRTDPRFEGLIGFFVNTVVLRTDLSGAPTFRQLLARVATAAVEAYAHQDLPIEKLVAALKPVRDGSHSSLFTVMFAFQNAPVRPLALEGIEVVPVAVDNGMVPLDLTLFAEDHPDGLSLRFNYDARILEASTIERWLGHLQTLLDAVLADPDRSIDELPVLTEAQCRKILVEWNDTACDYPRDATVDALVSSQAAQRPEAVALEAGLRRLTYRQLDAWADRLARDLRHHGVGPDTPVAIWARRSAETIAGMLGVLRAGGAYLPLDPDDPEERIRAIVDDSGARVALLQRGLCPARGLPAERLVLDDDPGELQAASAGSAPPRAAGDLAYIMYTSGSSGSPKGVGVPHRAVVRLVRQSRYANLDAGEVFLQFAPLSFDASTFEIWGCLANGGRLVVCPPALPSLDELGRIIESHRVTTLWLTAGLFHEMVDTRLDRLHSVRQLLAGGDVLSPDHVNRALAALPGCTVINGYGPTENTTFSCCHAMREPGPAGRPVPIGRPIANTRAYVLDASMRPVPVGVAGELYLSGDGLARGYLGQPELTARRFLPDPFGAPGERIYRTGDAVRWLADGTLEFLGRLDRQVKIRGFRVELEEVESVLARHPGVRQCAVVAREDARGTKRLAAFVIPVDPRAPPAADALGVHLRRSLPEPMVPAAFATLPRLPLTPNGKVDREALRVTPLELAARTGRRVVPADPTQHLLAELWEELLGVRSIGVRDDFFELGGHSLLAMKMLGRVEELFGKEIPAAALLADPTIANLSALLVSEPPDRSEPPMVEIQPGRSLTPLFFLHGDFNGHGYYCRKLARQLGPDRPFFSIHPAGSVGQQVPSSIEEMARSHLELVRARQPRGPYLLAGYCNGALEAFEMARQLRAAGEVTDLLVLLAPPAVARRSCASPVSAAWRRLLCRAFPLLGGRAVGRRLPLLRRAYLLMLYGAICRTYFPGPYDGPVVLVQCGDACRPGRDDTEGWASVAARTELAVVPGHHASLITQHSHVLAEQLRPRLRAGRPVA